MGNRDGRVITVALDHPEQLFTARDVSPMSTDYTVYTAQPAMDTVRDELLARMPRSHSTVTLNVVLPAEHIHDSLADDLTVAVRRWVEVQNALDIDLTTADTSLARRIFALCVATFFALQTTSIWVRQVGEDMDNFLVDAASEGLSVASWVVLWFPVQIATVEGWRARVRRRRMTVIERMTVTVTPR
jgi:hypothetical protein